MSVQPSLFDEQLDLGVTIMALIPVGAHGTIDERFARFDAANPWVHRALVNLTADLVRRGRRKVGMKMLFEVLRWHTLRATEGEDFRLNNNFTSRYARKLMAEHPEWDGLFDTRELRS